MDEGRERGRRSRWKRESGGAVLEFHYDKAELGVGPTHVNVDDIGAITYRRKRDGIGGGGIETLDYWGRESGECASRDVDGVVAHRVARDGKTGASNNGAIGLNYAGYGLFGGSRVEVEGLLGRGASVSRAYHPQNGAGCEGAAPKLERSAAGGEVVAGVNRGGGLGLDRGEGSEE
jgi:hypothetical protein